MSLFLYLPAMVSATHCFLPYQVLLPSPEVFDILDSQNWHQQHNCENIIGFILTASNNGLFKEFVFICSSTVLCL